MQMYRDEEKSSSNCINYTSLLVLACLSITLILACEPPPPCPSKTELEGEFPPERESELEKSKYKSFAASCVIPGSHGPLRHGFYKVWYRGGRVLKSQHTYEGGVRNGEYQLFFADGTLREKGTYRFGIKHGRYQSYHRNGKVHIEGEYQDGKKSGDFAIYSSNGTHVQKGPYFIDMKHGKWTSEYVSLNGRKITFLSIYHYGQSTVDN